MANNRSYRRNDPPAFEWMCPLTRTGKRSAHSTCAKEFAKELGFQLIETSDDGNCFFYTLAKFAKRSGYQPLLLEDGEHQNARALRQQLVQHIEENLMMYAPFLANNNEGSIYNQVNELRQNGAWASEAGDLVPIAGANAFGIHINMYNIVDNGDRDLIQLVPIRSQQPSTVYVSIMRVREGHFQLLWPRSGDFHVGSPSRSSPARSSPSRSSNHAHAAQAAQAVQAAHAAVEAAQVAVHAAQQIASPSRSLQSNEQKLNHIIQDLNQLSFGSAPRRSSRTTRSSRVSPPRSNAPSSRTRISRSTRKKNSYVNNNDELRQALEESMRYQ